MNTRLAAPASCPARASLPAAPAKRTNAPAVVPTKKDDGNSKKCCAASCSGAYKAGSTDDTCSLKCNDHGNYYCLPDSTFCADGYFEWAGPCNTSNGDNACPAGFCCVHDNYYSDKQFVCLKCKNSGE